MPFSKSLPTKSIPFNGDTITVSSISFAELVAIIQDRAAYLGPLFDRHAIAVTSPNAIPPEVSTAFALDLLQTLPHVMAAFIARAVGEPDEIEFAASLPFGIQVEILDAAFQLTFANMPPIDVINMVARAIRPLSSLHSGVRQ